MLAMDTMTTTRQSWMTPFGSVEDCNLLNTLPENNVTRVDTLSALEGIWGENILEQREKLYKIVSGTCSDEEFRSLITEFYTTYAAFSNFVDEVYLFEDHNIPLVTRIIQPARNRINAMKSMIQTQCRTYSGQIHGEHQDYVYISFTGPLRPKYERSEEIC